MIRILLGIILTIAWGSLGIAEGTAPLSSAHIDLQDKASLQRGAKYFVNYCMGCHSLKYQRYKRMAEDLNITNANGQVDEKLLKENLIFTNDTVFDTMNIAMPMAQAAKWFGVAPPDLSLEARARGADWIYTYLLSFYQDPARPWGVNNAVFPEVAMPNVLGNLQGVQLPHKLSTVDGVKVIDYLELKSQGAMGTIEFQQMVNDITNFLVYVGEPGQMERESLGCWVLLFLVILSVLTYLLYKEYWKDVH
jgi:ubiquinol-cytochrome c reductase cytochrome c1 subunit